MHLCVFDVLAENAKTILYACIKLSGIGIQF